MPATGNNTSEKQKILSICVSADGLCFWLEDCLVKTRNGGNNITTVPYTVAEYKHIKYDRSESLENNMVSAAAKIKETYFNDGKTGFDNIFVYSDSVKTILVPEGIYTSGAENGYIKLHNYTIERNEQIDVSESVNGTIAIIINKKDILRVLGESFGEFSVFSPSQYNIFTAEGTKLTGRQSKRNSITVFLSDTSIHIAVYGNNGISSKLLHTGIFPYSKHDDILFYINRITQDTGSKKPSILFKGAIEPSTESFLKKHFKKAVCA